MKKQEIYQELSKYYDNYQITELILKETDFTKNQLFLSEEIEIINQKWLEKQIPLAENWFPFEYIIQKAEFYWSEFYVDQRTLIPRDDTEIMVDCVLELLSWIIPPPTGTPFEKERNKWITLIDIWTWSSCIPISILNNSSNISHTFVVDIMKQALEVSKINIDRHNYSKVITQFHWSLLKPVISLLKWNIIITANLPYILDNDFEHMDKETVEHEPASALYWGPVTWFELYEQLIQECLELIKSWKINTINLFIEIWFDQKEYSQKYLNNLWLKSIYYKDNWWVERCIHIVI